MSSPARTPSDVMARGVALERLPQPDYATHPAYGVVFPKASLALRVRALARFVPWFGLVTGKRLLLFDRLPTLPDYDGPMSGGFVDRIAAIGRYAPLIARGLFEQLTRLLSRRWPAPLSPAAAALSETLSRDGIAPARFTPEEMNAIRAQLEEPLQRLVERRNTAGFRSFEGNQTWLNVRDAGPLFALVAEVLARHGIVAAAEAYLGRPVALKHLTLQINDSNDSYQHMKFADVGLPDPATNYMHCDTSEDMLKCMVYLSEVTERTGPFCYVRGSNRIPVGTFEGLVRRANDRAGFSGYTPEARRLFMALPAVLRRKATFGSDLLDGSPESRAALEAEHAFVSADGDAALFDNLGIHRGALVRDGERRVLIANLA